MKKMKRLAALTLTAAMTASLLTACGSGSGTEETTKADGGAAPAETTAAAAETTAAAAETTAASDGGASGTGEGAVYYLNFKPEQADQWVALAEVYTQETGVPVTVVTAASETYEQTLKSEMAKSEAPTLFQVNGPVGLSTWKDYCYDLKV